MKLFGRVLKLKNKSHAKTHLPANLRDDSQRFKVIIDSIEQGVILLDDQRDIQMINPGASAMCGWKAEEALGLDISNVVKLVTDKGEPYPDAANPILKIFESSETLHGENTFLMSKDHKQIPVSLSVSPLLNDKQQVTAAVVIISDTTQERAAEQQRADFISTASHEMRTPVAAIEGYLALALNEKVSTIDERARGYLDKAHTSTQHLGKLFQDLLTSAKAEDGRLTSHPGVVELGAFMEQLASDLKLVAEKKGLALEFKGGKASATIDATSPQGGQRVIRPLYYVYADPDRLREVLTNLFDNAVKYTERGKVTLSITGNEQIVQCAVKDTGPGIPADDLPHLFQKFYRVDNSATRTIGGSGLGLFICRKIVELYNGRIWAESELDKGSSFYINLPRLSTEKATQLQNSTAPSEFKPLSADVAP